VVNVNGTDCCWLTPLNAVQARILALLGFPSALYQGIGGNLVNWPSKWVNRELESYTFFGK
jgi:hypothetical protein